MRFGSLLSSLLQRHLHFFSILSTGLRPIAILSVNARIAGVVPDASNRVLNAALSRQVPHHCLYFVLLFIMDVDVKPCRW